MSSPIQGQDPSQVTRSLETNTVLAAKKRVDNFMGHAYAMLRALGEQNKNLLRETTSLHESLNPIGRVYKKAESEINEVHQRLTSFIVERNEGNPSLEKNQIKQLAKLIKTAENEIGEIIAKAQREIIVETAKSIKDQVIQTTRAKEQAARGAGVSVSGRNLQADLQELKREREALQHLEIADKVRALAENGIKAKFIKLVAWIPIIGDSYAKAQYYFKASMEKMHVASQAPVAADATLTQLEADRLNEFQAYRMGSKGSLKARAGVIGISGIYRFEVLTSGASVKKQFRSFMAQLLSDQPRTVIEKAIQGMPDRKKQDSGQTCTSTMIPLNQEFDRYIGLKGKATQLFSHVFGSIVGNKGISSFNRQDPRLVNGWMSTLESGGKILQRVFRGGVAAADPLDAEKRPEKARQAVEDVLRAVVMQEIADQGLTDQDLENLDRPIELNLNSVGLLTPDSYRWLFAPQNDERKVLFDQIDAFHSFEGEGQTVSIPFKDPQTERMETRRIPIKLQVNTFNFGVNEGAVRGIFGTGIKFKVGLEKQYVENKKALKGLQAQYDKLMEEIKANHGKWTAQHADHRSLVYDMQLLMNDINTMMEDHEAYLNGENQYEIGAKIVNLTNAMSKVKREVLGKPAGLHALIQCFSGKDRTTFMDCVIKSFAMMREVNGSYPTAAQLLNDKDLREQFVAVLVKFLEESGGLEITELNTNAMGIKVNVEAMIAGMSAQDFIYLIGLSKTTSR